MSVVFACLGRPNRYTPGSRYRPGKFVWKACACLCNRSPIFTTPSLSKMREGGIRLGINVISSVIVTWLNITCSWFCLFTAASYSALNPDFSFPWLVAFTKAWDSNVAYHLLIAWKGREGVKREGVTLFLLAITRSEIQCHLEFQLGLPSTFSMTITIIIVNPPKTNS